MGVLEDLADGLAKDALETAENMGDETLVMDIAKQLGATSTTMEEAYLTAIRVRQSEIRGRRYLEARQGKASMPSEGFDLSKIEPITQLGPEQ